MASHNIIALIYDCDKTLIPDFMQVPIFDEYGVDEGEFWTECLSIVEEDKNVNVDQEMAYMNAILRHVRGESDPKFGGLSNRKLRELGSEIKLFHGLPSYFSRVKSLIEKNPRFEKHDIKVEHYIISTGLKEMILGSSLNDSLTDVFASEYLEREGLISEIARAVGYTNKTRFIFEINKGPDVEVNEKISPEDRRIPFENMIYIGDGPTDVPCFSLMNKKGGYSIAVYDPKSEEAFTDAYQLREENRIFGIGPADYRRNSHTSKLIEKTLEQIAERIVQNNERKLT